MDHRTPIGLWLRKWVLACATLSICSSGRGLGERKRRRKDGGGEGLRNTPINARHTWPHLLTTVLLSLALFLRLRLRARVRQPPRHNSKEARSASSSVTPLTTDSSSRTVGQRNGFLFLAGQHVRSEGLSSAPVLASNLPSKWGISLQGVNYSPLEKAGGRGERERAIS